jgi:hypothetical protein
VVNLSLLLLLLLALQVSAGKAPAVLGYDTASGNTSLVAGGSNSSNSSSGVIVDGLAFNAIFEDPVGAAWSPDEAALYVTVSTFEGFGLDARLSLVHPAVFSQALA